MIYKNIFIIVAINFFMASFLYASIKPFQTDGCTFFYEGNWKDCCLEHDLYYWIGGDQDKQDMADLKLKYCIEKAQGKTYAALIYFMVRLGHYSPIKYKYHWGWGRENAKKYHSELEENEIKKLKIMLKVLEEKGMSKYSFWDDFIDNALN